MKKKKKKRRRKGGVKAISFICLHMRSAHLEGSRGLASASKKMANNGMSFVLTEDGSNLQIRLPQNSVIVIIEARRINTLTQKLDL